MLHGFSWKKWTSGTPTECLQLIPAGQEHILEKEDGKMRWVQVVTKLPNSAELP
jgi:type I restriction enzyme R subunit